VEKGPADLPKRSVSAAIPELPLLEPTWTPPRIGFGRTVWDAGFLLLVVLSVAWAWQPLTTIISRSLNSEEYEHYSHIILLPFISAYLLYLNRDVIFRQVKPALGTGCFLVGAGAAVIWFARTPVITGDPEYLSFAMLGLITLLAGGFALCYGLRALWSAAFPFLLLLFMVPLPAAALTKIIVFLQKASADASAVLFALIGMPTFRDGFDFALPGLAIRVAEECSGIRSSLALLISGLVMAYLVLRSAWTRTALVLAIIPLAIVKNAVRIVLLSWLAVHVDPSFITGSAVHRTSGIPVFVASLTILSGLAWLLRRGETWSAGRTNRAPKASALSGRQEG
jgi:exosortase